ncbi:MAG: aldo/keto reductase [Spirulina sp. SIO3F2]|nr:aldo/keto reductase [Spirulina sp. SIO3F2]
MEYRRFGRTELRMPVFSCGGMRYQHKWQDISWSEIPTEGQANVAATIERALELGINHIETARGYGSSEMQLGQVLPTLPREQIIVQTKVSPKADAQVFRQTLEQSLDLLQLDYVDLLGIHGINNAELLEQTIRPGGCLAVAREFQAAGRVRFVGFSTHGSTQAICNAIATDEFDYVNLHWYYINQFNWPAIAAAKAHDMGVFIISPSDKGGHLYNPPPKLTQLCQPLSPMVFNDLFCLSHPEVHTLSLGAARPSDFDEHLKTLPLLAQASEILAPILAKLEAEASQVLGESWYHTWYHGLPDPGLDPSQVAVRTILWLSNLATAYDMMNYAQARYNLLGNASHWFPGRRAEQIDATELQTLLQNSPHRESIPSRLAEAHQMLGGKAVKRLSQQ